MTEAYNNQHRDQNDLISHEDQQDQQDLFSHQGFSKEIPFNKSSLMDYLRSLEEDNLFRIHLVQEDEQALDKLKKDIDFKIKSKEKEIAEVKQNIDMLEASKMLLLQKQYVLDTTMKSKQNNDSQGNKTQVKFGTMDTNTTLNEEVTKDSFSTLQ